jgi:hypothetical protein
MENAIDARWLEAARPQDKLESAALGETRLLMVECHACARTWAAVAPWECTSFRCPVCRSRAVAPYFSRGEELVQRLVAALTHLGGLEPLAAYGYLRDLFEIDADEAVRDIPEAVRAEALAAVEAACPLCGACNGAGVFYNEAGEIAVCDACDGNGCSMRGGAEEVGQRVDKCPACGTCHGRGVVYDGIDDSVGGALTCPVCQVRGRSETKGGAA